jgi:UDP-N-acetyl-alpha-D-muramoyl-L-alanyl-L-glutamate epimerase
LKTASETTTQILYHFKMSLQDKRFRYEQLRKEFSYFSYESYHITVTDTGLEVVYHFNLADRYHFYPSFSIPTRDFYDLSEPERIGSDTRLHNLIFHIGMVELISYWKAACPPRLLIKPFSILPEQVEWWKEVYFQGLGEFFYLNSIVPEKHSFMQIECTAAKYTEPFDIDLDNKLIIPVGGGKDSVVTLELLSHQFDTLALILNPRGASLLTAETAGFPRDRVIEINRTIDPLLLELNNQDFLNGHTPFSALLAFECLLASALTGRKHIALSNESSANEATVENTEVNHQYSKSIAFESDFRWYVSRFISPAFNYFSFLRPVNELQIGRLFAGFPAYFDVFKSCNVGSKTDVWCGHCPKCLFAYIILSPFISRDRMEEIFGKDIFAEEALWPYLRQLSGLEDIKPFECVGTVDEVNLALQIILEGRVQKELPVLLRKYAEISSFSHNEIALSHKLLNEFNEEHFLQDDFLSILKAAVS